MVKKCLTHCSLTEALATLLASANELRRATKFPMENSVGHILATDVFSKKNVPHYTASAVDGYAIISDRTRGATSATPISLITDFEWINTGGCVPDWANAIIMVEDVSLSDGVLIVRKTVIQGENVRAVGEDIAAGSLLAYAGDSISPALLSLFLCSGIYEVNVYSKPRIVFIPTGNEIIDKATWEGATPPPSGLVVDSNSILIENTLNQWGYDVDIHPIVRDDPNLLKEVINKVTERYDIVLIGAGSSKGDRDHTEHVLDEMGDLLFHWVLSKPGRPAMAAKMRKGLLLCLPGFSISTAVILWSLVYPLLSFVTGKDVGSIEDMLPKAIGAHQTLFAKLLLPHSSPQGVQEWLRVQVAQIGESVYGWPLPSGASNISSLANADGIALLPASLLECDKGTSIVIWVTKKIELSKRILFQGSDDPAIHLLVAILRRQGQDMVIRSVGSMGGLAALHRHEAHLAGSHLLDSETGCYNTSYINLFRGEELWQRNHLFDREQGLLLKRGNPKGIKSIEDIVEKEAVFVNRQPGAGTRVLFDFLLKRQSIEASLIKGYERQCVTHLEVANRVAMGLADVALGVKSAADALGLDFLPITKETYELIFPKESLSLEPMRVLLESINDVSWKKKVEQMGGYSWPN